ncbi:hypothetical protein CBM2585_A130063 [Cupriavidus taiwanensis]|nr:hypothetical protein CBM2585_A130063 [Cupriavidus taiwanensis]
MLPQIAIWVSGLESTDGLFRKPRVQLTVKSPKANSGRDRCNQYNIKGIRRNTVRGVCKGNQE